MTHFPLSNTFLTLSVFLLALSACTSGPSSVTESIESETSDVQDASTQMVEDLGVLCTWPNGETFYSHELDEMQMRFYDYSELIPQETNGESWYSYPALGLAFQYSGPDHIFQRNRSLESDVEIPPSLLFTTDDQAECVSESVDGWSTEISFKTEEELVALKESLLSDGALPEDSVSYGGKTYEHIRGFNFGNGIADFFFKEQGARTYVFTFTWLHDSMDDRSTVPLPQEYQKVLETLEFL